MLITLIIKRTCHEIAIILLSIVALAIILERLWVLWRVRLNIPQFVQEILLYLERGHFKKTLERCEKIGHPIIAIIGVEPMLGFLGTLTDLIRTSMAWENLGNDITVNEKTRLRKVFLSPLLLFPQLFSNKSKKRTYPLNFIEMI